MSPFLGRLGQACARHPVRTVLGWLLLAAAALVGARLTPAPPESAYGLPGSPSATAAHRLAAHLPGGEITALVVAHSARSLRGGPGAAAVAGIAAAAERLPHVVRPLGPRWSSDDGSTVLLPIAYDRAGASQPARLLAALQRTVRRAAGTAVEVSVTGDLVRLATEGGTGSGEAVGFGLAAFALLLAFGSVVSAGVPVVSAGVALGAGLGLVGLLSGRYHIDPSGPALATMIGVGVGVDYALLLVTRHREEMARGHPAVTAAGRATGTAGASAVSAGVTVIVAILGLAVAGVPVITSLGVATAVVLAVVVAAAVTLVPALLGLAGARLDALRLTRLPVLAHRPLLDPDLVHVPPSTPWYRWARTVERHPLPYALASTAVLVLLAVPTLGIQLGQADASSAPAGSGDRRGYERIATAFGVGANSPLVVTVFAPRAGLQPAEVRAAALPALRADPAVLTVFPAVVSPDRTLAAIAVVARSAPQAATTRALVRRLRDRVLPTISRQLGGTAQLTGAIAGGVDFGDQIVRRLPYVAVAVLVLSFLLLVALFRSIVVPLKAVLLNLLSVAAACGILVAVFQWGWLGPLVGLPGTVPVLEVVPMIVFAVAFGLSMDYEVFLLARVREEWLLSGNARESVVVGLGSTARVISAAATIMVSVFLAFTLSPSVTVKMFGVGLAAAVLLDASLIRLVLVPATMTLLGDRNWYLPRWLDRVLPGGSPSAPP